MEVFQINEKELHDKEKGNVEMLQTNESPSSHVTSPVIMTMYGTSFNDADKSILAANLAAYIGERHFPVSLVDLNIIHDNPHASSRLHGVKPSPDELGVLEAWVAYDALAVISVVSGDAPVVKPSTKARGVYVMPPGNVTPGELVRKKTDDMTAEMLRSLIVRQAERYRTSFVIIDAPSRLYINDGFTLSFSVVPSSYISDFALSISDMAAVVLTPPPIRASRELKVIMKHAGDYLTNLSTVFVVMMEDAWSVGGRINAPFPVHQLPHSLEFYSCSRYFDLIFITTEPKSDDGRRWQAEFARFAEAVVNKAKEILRNKATKS